MVGGDTPDPSFLGFFREVRGCNDSCCLVFCAFLTPGALRLLGAFWIQLQLQLGNIPGWLYK